MKGQRRKEVSTELALGADLSTVSTDFRKKTRGRSPKALALGLAHLLVLVT